MEKLYIKVNKDAFRERLVLLENENKVRERGLSGRVAGSGFRFPSQRRAPARRWTRSFDRNDPGRSISGKELV